MNTLCYNLICTMYYIGTERTTLMTNILISVRNRTHKCGATARLKPTTTIHIQVNLYTINE